MKFGGGRGCRDCLQKQGQRICCVAEAVEKEELQVEIGPADFIDGLQLLVLK